MSVLEIWLLALALAMDCFTVSIANGIIQKRIVKAPMFFSALLFGLFQSFMPLMGWLAVNHFSEYIEQYDHWIAFALLSFIGAKMVWDGSHPEREHSYHKLSYRIIFILAIATSIDALAVGISFACLGMNTLSAILYPVCVIGFVSFVMSLIGLAIGIFIGKKFNWPVEIVGGIILILIGVKILITHLNLI